MATFDTHSDSLIGANRRLTESGTVRGHALPGSTRFWVLGLCFAALAIPTLISLGRQVWPLEIGAHGPIVLAAGIWLLVRAVPAMRTKIAPSSTALVFAGALVAAVLYAFGRAFDYLSVEVFAVCAMIWLLAYYWFGAGALKAHVFPLIFLLFLVPPPGWAVDRLTMPLQMLVSELSTAIMQVFDYPIINSGIAITIGSYELLVEEACSGMNSLFGLTAVALLYIYLQGRASLPYAALLVALIVPLAIAVNLVRVLILILLTYHAGDGAAQGFLHLSSGVILFAFALFAMFLLDHLLRKALPRNFVERSA